MNKRQIAGLWTTLLIVASIGVAVWIGVTIGRGVERKHTYDVINQMSGRVSSSEADIDAFAREMAAVEHYMAGSDKMMQTIMAIRSSYVDPIDLDTIYEKAIPALLSELDPHSEYIPAKMFDKVNESLEGEFDGIGIVFNAMTDTITVLSVIPQGPSDKAGVRAGDRVMRIDGRNVAGQNIPQDSMVRMMRGPRGTKVTLSVQRARIDNLVDIEVIRDAIELHSVETAFMLDNEAKIGFIRLSQFSRTSYKEIRRALDKLAAEGMQGVIIDLRGNGGGFLDQVIPMVNEFLPAGKLIV